jgi:hypothetical protein
MEKTVAALTNKENIEQYKAVIDLEKFGKPTTELLILALRNDERFLLTNHPKERKGS